MAAQKLNRIKIVLAEQGRTNKWLAEKMSVGTTTVSRWCTNEMQPSLQTLFDISDVLKVNVRELLVSNR
jgi:putative transcriptional regulator